MEYLVEPSTERTLYRMVLAAMTTVKFCEGSNLCAVIQFNELHFAPPSFACINRAIVANTLFAPGL